MGFFPPLGLESIATVLEPYAREVEIVDLRKDPRRTRDFVRPDTDIVCFSLNWKRDPGFLREEIRSVPDHVPTVVGGRYATEDPAYWLEACPNLDTVVRGDGEEAAEEIFRGDPVKGITGVSFRNNGNIHHNESRTLGPLGPRAYPNRKLRAYTYDVEFEGNRTGILIDTVSSSRGCPFNCAFCSFSRNPWGKKREWSARPAESVVEELSQVEARIVGFADDLFTFDMERVERICDLIIERGIRKKYIVNARLEIARRPDVLRKMERAGFIMLMLGVESAHDKTLRSMRKGFDTARIRECFKVLRRSSMILHGYFILGCIGESVKDMRRIVPFAHELGLDTIAISTLRSSPYSGLDELVRESPGYHIAPNGKIYSDECSVRELKELRRRIYRAFFTPRQIARFTQKAVRNGALSFLPAVLPRVPGIAWRAALRMHRRSRRRARRKAALSR